jgi:G:T-mismatch repair DNA endonuclease (very short patch repair protein)
VTFYCDNCGKELERSPYCSKSKHQFCDSKCYGEWKSKNIIKENHPMYNKSICYCDNCGIEVEVANYVYQDLLAGKRKNVFCSNKCNGEWNSKNRFGKNNPLYTQVLLTCSYCGEEYMAKYCRKDISNFCSPKCSQMARSKRIKINCAYCEKEIYLKPSEVKEHNFCSNKCVGKWNGKKDSRVSKICVICNKEYKVKPVHADKSVTCSTECQKEWQSKVYYKRPEVIEFRRKVAVNNLLNQKYKDTKPERIVKQYLINNNISFIFQHPLYNSFVVDFYLPEHDVIIEVLGDYWHGNPRIYNNINKPLSDKQQKARIKDEKRCNFLTNKGHGVYFVWECDIYKDIKSSLSFLYDLNILCA